MTAQPREPGWYYIFHVEKPDFWWCAEWDGKEWDRTYPNKYVEENAKTGPRIPSPASRPDPLAARLVELRDMSEARLKVIISNALHESGNPGFALYVPDIVAPAIIAALADRDGWRAGVEAAPEWNAKLFDLVTRWNEAAKDRRATALKMTGSERHSLFGRAAVFETCASNLTDAILALTRPSPATPAGSALADPASAEDGR